jgi:hypothetical protein
MSVLHGGQLCGQQPRVHQAGSQQLEWRRNRSNFVPYVVCMPSEVCAAIIELDQLQAIASALAVLSMSWLLWYCIAALQ